MSRVVRAKVLTNSEEDKNARVKLKVEGFIDETPLVESVGGIPLKKGDFVFVDVTEGYEEALILGRSFDSKNKFEKSVDGSLLFESSDGSKWTIGYVKNNKLNIANSDSVEIEIDGGKIKIDADKIEMNGGNNKGLVNVESFQQLLDAVKTFGQTMMGDTVLANYGCAISIAAASTLFASCTPIINYEDKKVTH